MKLYLAGRMTGVPKHNIPAFDAAAADLRARGYEVISPAELDDPKVRRMALKSKDGAPIPGATWGQFLARDVQVIADEKIDGVVVLPEWHESKGALLETFVARLLGLPIYRYAPTTTRGVTRLNSQRVVAVHSDV